jgi:hypothetical protein
MVAISRPMTSPRAPPGGSFAHTRPSPSRWMGTWCILTSRTSLVLTRRIHPISPPNGVAAMRSVAGPVAPCAFLRSIAIRCLVPAVMFSATTWTAEEIHAKGAVYSKVSLPAQYQAPGSCEGGHFHGLCHKCRGHARARVRPPLRRGKQYCHGPHPRPLPPLLQPDRESRPGGPTRALLPELLYRAPMQLLPPHYSPRAQVVIVGDHSRPHGQEGGFGY